MEARSWIAITFVLLSVLFLLRKWARARRYRRELGHPGERGVTPLAADGSSPEPLTRLADRVENLYDKLNTGAVIVVLFLAGLMAVVGGRARWVILALAAAMLLVAVLWDQLRERRRRQAAGEIRDPMGR